MMTVDSLDEYIEILSGHIYDNDKVVTYKWLSKELEVHVNVAKEILREFAERHQQDENIVTTYLLMGTLNDGGIHVEVVKDENLNAAKEKYSNIIAQHIYSLQKTLLDIELLAISGEGDVKFSAIQCSEGTQRSDKEMHVLRWGTTLSSELSKTDHQKPKSFGAVTTGNETSTKTEKSVTANIKTTTPQKKGFGNLFAKAENKQKSLTKKHALPTKSAENVKKSPPTNTSLKKKSHQTGIGNFLGPSNQQESVKKSVPSETKRSDEKSADEHVQSTRKAIKTESRGKKRSHSKESTSTKPKRKRITIQIDSSESEMSHEEVDDVEEIPPSPERIPSPKNRSPSPPKTKVEGGKRKVLKMVDKTFEEDGFLVTKKVHIYESCSEEEPDKVEVKISSPPGSRTDAKGKKATKQTTLMNFFKKS